MPIDSEQELRDFLENAQDGVHCVGADGTILSANAAELSLLGYSSDEYVGQHISRFYVGGQVFEDLLARVGRNEQLHDYPAQMRHKDGSTRHVVITSSVLWRGGEVVHIRCITRDVTRQTHIDRKRDRLIRQLAAEHAITRTLAETKPLAQIARELLATLAEVGEWQLGLVWTLDEVTDMLRFVDAWHSPDIDATGFIAGAREWLFIRGTGIPGHILATEQMAAFEDIAHNKNFPRAHIAARLGLHGAIGFPIRKRGRVVGVVEFFSREIRQPDADLLLLFDSVSTQIGHFMERREADEVRDRLAAIVDSSDDAIVSKTLDGVITSWNRGAERIFGYTSEEAVGQHITLIIPPDRHGEEDDVLARLRRGERVDHYETIRRTKDGRSLDISLTVSPVRNGEGRIVGASKVARDVTVSKRAQEILRQREEQARAEVQQRDEFLSIAAHELRNPLNALQLQLVHLCRAADRMEGDPPKRWIVERLGQSTEDIAALVRLVHNLLDVARISSGRLTVEPEDVQFDDVVQTVLRRFGPDLAETQVVLDTPAVGGRSDRLRLEQVLTNLISNAIKYGEGKPIEVVLRSDRDNVFFAVTDHGIGIDPEIRSQLFERFARGVARRQFGGFGLGLWIARETVRAMRGQIWVTSAPGEGSTFSVALPRILLAEPAGYVTG